MNSIGILGAGAIGTAFARALARAGMSAVIANSRGPASLAGLVRDLGDLGSLAVGGRLVQFPGGPLPALHLVKF